MGQLSSSFLNKKIDGYQDAFEGMSSLDPTAPVLPVMEDPGKIWNQLQVKNPSVCKYLCVKYEVKLKNGTLVEEVEAICPEEIRTIGFDRAAITKVIEIGILDTAALAPGAWSTSDGYTKLAAPTVDDFAEDGGAISGILVRLLNC